MNMRVVVAAFLFTLGACSDSTAPKALAAPLVAAGWEHTCALDNTGRAFCWGNGGSGRLGNGADTNAAFPVAVAGNLRFISIGASQSSTCAKTADGAVWCWGRGIAGMLGARRDTMPALRPVAVAGGLRFRTMSVGSDHVCALTSSDDLYCWGMNDAGQLGDTLQTNDSCFGFRCAQTPQLINTGLKFQSVTSGFGTTCGLASGVTYCWGYNAHGQAGRSPNFTNLYQPNSVVGDVGFRDLSAGWFHTCGLDSAGIGFCWGWGSNGQLGNDTSGVGVETYTATPVSGNFEYSTITGGHLFSCAITTNGAVMCWGESSAVAGGGNITATPQLIASAVSFQALSAGQDHVCAVSRDGEIFCWGYAEFGLGNGTTLSPTPAAVELP